MGATLAVVALLSLALTGCSYTHCIVEGTLIATPFGELPIEDLVSGDPVTSCGVDGTMHFGRVTATSEAGADEFLEIAVDGRSAPLRVTALHPIAIVSGEWRPAGELVAGDVVVTSEGPAAISEVRRRRRSVRVFDLAVEPQPAFLAAGVVVHNKTFDRPPTREQLVGSWVGLSGWASYLIDLRADGKAQLVVIQRFRSEELTSIWKASEWTLDGSNLCIVFGAPPEKSGVRILNVHVNDRQLTVRDGAPGATSWSTKQFVRAEEAMHMLDALRTVMAGAE